MKIHKKRNALLIISISMIVLALNLALPAQAQATPVIIDFSYDNLELIYDEVEGGIASSVFSWEAINVTAPYAMQMHAMVGGVWALIGENFDPVKSDTLVIAHPLSFQQPLYRLSIVDSNGMIVDEARLQLTYADTDPDGDAEISDFTLLTETVSRSRLRDGTARIDLQWDINNRLATSNIIFQQLMPDGSLQNIELPRFDSWMRAEGSGTVAPINVPAASQIVIQARLFDITNGNTLQSMRREITIVEDPVTAVPTATDVPDTIPYIYFAAPHVVSLASTITLSWDIPASRYPTATEVIIREWHSLYFGGKYGDQPGHVDTIGEVPVNEWTGLALNGSISVDVPDEFPESTLSWRDYQNVVVYQIYLVGEGLQQEGFAHVAVYLRTPEEETNCTAVMDAPESITTGNYIDLSWDACGLPYVRVEVSSDPYVDMPWYSLMPLSGDGGLITYTINLPPELSAMNVTFTITDLDGNALASRTVAITR